MGFAKFNLTDKLVEGIEGLGYVQPTPVQEQVIPLLLQGNDLVGCAQTGTGKTAAFLIPVIQRLMKKQGGNTRCLIVVPTRELAMQIDQQVTGLGYFTGISSCPVYGGNQPELFDVQKRSIQQGADILIATPGRLLGHINLGYVDLSCIEFFVLDEADRMLDMGFIEDIQKIISHLPAKRQTMMFSATMPPKIRQLAKNILTQPAEVSLSAATPAEGIHQLSYLVSNRHKITLLEQLIRSMEIGSMLIFASTKNAVDDINRTLKKMGMDVKSIHSGKTQDERTEIMRRFKAGKIQIMVATDILSRGIDVDGITHVINYDVPSDPEDYIHRIGRTARAERSGVAITFINEEDQECFQRIERMIGRELLKMNIPKSIGASPAYNPRQGGGRKRRRAR